MWPEFRGCLFFSSADLRLSAILVRFFSKWWVVDAHSGLRKITPLLHLGGLSPSPMDIINTKNHKTAKKIFFIARKVWSFHCFPVNSSFRFLIDRIDFVFFYWNQFHDPQVSTNSYENSNYVCETLQSLQYTKGIRICIQVEWMRYLEEYLCELSHMKTWPNDVNMV